MHGLTNLDNRGLGHARGANKLEMTYCDDFAEDRLVVHGVRPNVNWTER